MTIIHKKHRIRCSVFFRFLTYIVASVALVYCTNGERTQTISADGFLVIKESSDWIFFPAKNLDLESCQRNFMTDELQLGIRIYPEQLADTTYSILERSADTMTLTRPIEVEHGFQTYVRIAPVSIKYFIENRFVGTVSRLRSKFSLHSKEKKISFEYDQFPLQILSLNPIFCLSKKKSDTAEIECLRIKEDIDGYLFKICEYLTSNNKFTTLPSRYKIKSVRMDSLNGQEVIAVELTCCYLGDVAYFDPASKELLSLKLGAK